MKLCVLLLKAFWQKQKSALLVFAASLAAFEHIWGGRFYSSQTHVGHDFAGSALSLLEGKFWIDSNGFWTGILNPPWFTPAWCSGSVFYADPQSLFYSPIQLFALWMNPFQATHLSTLLFAAVGFWGCFALARKTFLWEQSGAIIFAVLGMVNAFLPMRSAVGESGYQPLYLWTFLALALCWPNRTEKRAVPWPSICVCLVLTAWLQFGFAGMMVTAFLGTLLLCFALVIVDKADFWTIIKRCSLGGTLAIFLNGSKLYESTSVMRNFPRSFYELPGFPSLSDALLSTAFALLQPSQWTAHFGMRKLTNVRFTALPHEWAVNFGWGAFVVAIVTAIALVAKRKSAEVSGTLTFRWTTSKSLALALMIPIAALAPLLLWNDGGARALIKEIPILNSAAWPMRWIVVLLPLVQFFLALPVATLLARKSSRIAAMVVAVATAVIWSGPLFEPIDYYLDPAIQTYAPGPVINAFNVSKVDGAIPITAIAFNRYQQLSANRNDTMLQGASQSLCYNPNYGYRLEMLPQRQWLKAGAPLSAKENGETLINNPVCLVHPEKNVCIQGSGFSISDPAQVTQAQRFIARNPFKWARPPLGNVLSLVSQIAFWLLLPLSLFGVARSLLSYDHMMHSRTLALSS